MTFAQGAAPVPVRSWPANTTPFISDAQIIERLLAMIHKGYASDASIITPEWGAT